MVVQAEFPALFSMLQVNSYSQLQLPGYWVYLTLLPASSNTSCLPAAPSDSIARISPNVTSTLTTCEPWGLTITNGARPYNVIFSALNSPVITNVTMGPEDDVFTYIDRADPNGELLGGYFA